MKSSRFGMRTSGSELGVLQTPAAVVKNGQWYADADLVRIREEAIESRSLWSEIAAL
jgi:hypothetical protein